MAAYDPRSHAKRREIPTFFRRFRLTSWILLFILAKGSAALIETDYWQSGSSNLKAYGTATSPRRVYLRLLFTAYRGRRSEN